VTANSSPDSYAGAQLSSLLWSWNQRRWWSAPWQTQKVPVTLGKGQLYLIRRYCTPQ